jgi:hypothetical protein
MARGRCTRITIETDRVLIVAQQQGIRLWCVRCGGEVEFATFDDPGPLLASGATVVASRSVAGWSAKLRSSVARFLREAVIG